MAGVKLSRFYGQLLPESNSALAQLYAQALLTDEALDPSLLSAFYAQCIFEQPTLLSDIYVQALVEPHPYPWMTEEVYSAAYCWRIDRTDGVSFGFTSHDQDLTFDGVTYEAATGFTPTAVDTSDSLSVDNLDVDGVLTSDRITENELAGGVYDFAKVTIYLVNWKNLDDPKFILRRGTIGRLRYGKTGFTAEIRGLTEAYQQKAGEVYQKTCRATLGDEKCKINLADYTTTGMVTAVNSDTEFTTNVIAADGAYDYGYVRWTSGDNLNTSVEVKTYTEDGTIEVYLPTVWRPQVGDTFTLVAGCDRNLSTCVSRFNNLLNFRGEPYVPGNDYQTSYATQGSSNVVSAGSNAARG